MASLAAEGADIIAFETIPSLKEAVAVVELLREFPNSDAWLSFSCKVSTAGGKNQNLITMFNVESQNDSLCAPQDEKRISDGSLFTDAVKVAGRSAQLLAVGVNCCPPAVVEGLLDSAGSLLSPSMSWVVYPNSGEEWNTEQG